MTLNSDIIRMCVCVYVCARDPIATRTSKIKTTATI